VSDFIVNPRRAPRAPSRCRVRVKTSAAQWDAETEDVGPHGCQLVAPAPLPRGEALAMALAGPGVREPLSVRAKVAWVSSQPPWRLGVAFEDAARPAASRFFEQLVAARPGLGNFRRVPDRLPVDAMVFLGPPPRFVDFSADEVTVLRHVAGGCTIEALRTRLAADWPVLQRALFALLSRGGVTVARGAAAHPESWRAVMEELQAEFVIDQLPTRTSPGLAALTPPPLQRIAAPPPMPAVEPIDLPPLEMAPLPMAPLQMAPPEPAAAEPAPPPPPSGPATAGTGWRGTGRTRSADAQEVFDLGKQELAEGRTKAAMALLRRALQLAPGDAEVAAELGRAMKG
jgi:hypothetical protein